MLAWQEGVREALKQQFHSNDVTEVSVNEIIDLLEIGFITPPPDVGNPLYRRGQANTSVFSGCDYYVKTGDKTPSKLKSSHGRKVLVWQYVPELDTRGADENWYH